MEHEENAPSRRGGNANPPEGAADAEPTERPRSSRAQALANSLLGREVGPYKVEEKLGEGGMGVVFKATDRALDRTVALKILFEIDEDANVKRFLQEAKALARLTHPNAIQIFWTGEFEGYPCFAMEHIPDGISVYDLLRHKGTLEVDDAVDIVVEAAKGLAAARRAGIVHRDIKPNNLLIDADGTVKISDFGLAKIIEDSGHLTQSGIVMGTPYYMSPEQGQGEPIDHRADLYSLGATFYHMVTGFTPYEAQNPVSLIIKHVKDPIPDIESVKPGIPPAIRQIIETCLAKSPDHRYQEYEDFIEDLEAYKAGRKPAHAEAAGRTARFPPWVWFVAGLALAGVGTGVALKYGGDSPIAMVNTPTAIPSLRTTAPTAAPSPVESIAPAPGEVEGAIAEMGSTDPILRARAAATFGKVVDINTLDELAALAQDREPRVRARAVWALGRFADPQALPPVVVALSDRDTMVAKMAIQALDGRASVSAVEPLQKVIASHPDAGVRRLAASVLEKIYQEDPDTKFGAKTGIEWRQEFRDRAERIADARRRYADAEQDVRYHQQRWGFRASDVVPPKDASPEARRAYRGVYAAALRTQKEAQEDVRSLESSLATLVKDADAAKVPPELRR